MMVDKHVSTPAFNPYLALVSGLIGVSTGAIFARLAGEAPALVIAAYRLGLASLILAPLAWCKCRSEIRGLSGHDLKLALLSGLFLALHFAVWISSLNYTSVANSVVLVTMNPLWVGLLTPLVTQERISRIALIGIIMSVIGGIIISAGNFTASGNALWGDFLALVGGVCLALYLLVGRKLRSKLSLLAYIMVCYGSAALILWGVVLTFRLPVTGFGTQTVASFWALALIPQLIGHTSYNWSLKWFSTSTVAVSLLAEPIGSTILAYFIFDEGITWFLVIGSMLIFFAIYLSALSESIKRET